MKFRVGDRVTVVTHAGPEIIGLSGVVVGFIGNPRLVGIDFKLKTLDFFHDLNGNIKTRTGYWLMEHSLKLSKQGTLRQYFKPETT